MTGQLFIQCAVGIRGRDGVCHSVSCAPARMGALRPHRHDGLDGVLAGRTGGTFGGCGLLLGARWGWRCSAACWRWCAAALVTVFLTGGIFPLVPGAGIYYTVYAFITGDNAAAVFKGVETLKIAGVIALGIVLVLALPKGVFRVFAAREKRQ